MSCAHGLRHSSTVARQSVIRRTSARSSIRLSVAVGLLGKERLQSTLVLLLALVVRQSLRADAVPRASNAVVLT